MQLFSKFTLFKHKLLFIPIDKHIPVSFANLFLDMSKDSKCLFLPTFTNIHLPTSSFIKHSDKFNLFNWLTLRTYPNALATYWLLNEFLLKFISCKEVFPFNPMITFIQLSSSNWQFTKLNLDKLFEYVINYCRHTHYSFMIRLFIFNYCSFSKYPWRKNIFKS